jgi:hypothetical protein
MEITGGKRDEHTFELLGLLNHAVDLLLRQTTLVVGDGDAVRLAGRLSEAETLRIPLASMSKATST